MSETDQWVQWWACAWYHAHPEWHSGYDVTPALARNRHSAVSKAFAIEPCLPGAPSGSLIYLALAQSAQHDHMLQLLDMTCRPLPPAQLNTPQNLWCQRLAKALHTQGWLGPTDDALQLLRAWVEPAVWQRLRLRFAPARIIVLEQTPVLAIPAGKLEQLWQAVLWYARTFNSDATLTEAQDHAVATLT